MESNQQKTEKQSHRNQTNFSPPASQESDWIVKVAFVDFLSLIFQINSKLLSIILFLKGKKTQLKKAKSAVEHFGMLIQPFTKSFAYF